jgi:hypothetical protein
VLHKTGFSPCEASEHRVSKIEREKKMSNMPKDLMDRLPAEALEKLRRLEIQSDELFSYIRESFTQLADLRQAIVMTEAKRDRLNGYRGGRSEIVRVDADLTFQAQQQRSLIRNVTETTPADDGEQRQELAAELARLNYEHRTITERQRFNGARNQALGGLLRLIKEWLELLPKNATVNCKPRVQPSRGEVTPDLLEKRRQRIRELLADLGQIDAAAYPAAAVKQRKREEIMQLADRGRPSVYQAIENLNEPIRWPEQIIDLSSTLHTPTALDGIALVAWLHRDVLIAAIEKEIDEAADDTQALTDAQRTERFKACLADLLKTEREEEALIHAASFEVLRRADADPRAVLGLSDALPGPKRSLLHREIVEGLTAVDDAI